MEMAVAKSGTLTLVEPFLVSHQPSVFSQHDYKHSQGRPKEWLTRLVPPSHHPPPTPTLPLQASSAALLSKVSRGKKHVGSLGLIGPFFDLGI